MPRAAIAALAIAILPVAAPAALAGTLSRSGGTLIYTAAPGEANQVSVFRADDGSFHFSDTAGFTADPGSGCNEFGECSGGVTAISIDGGDGDDNLGASGAPATLQGGDGNDEVNGTTMADTVRGGPGDDKLFGGPDSANDYVDGGPGNDLITLFEGDTLDCTGGGSDRVERAVGGRPARFVGCGAAPRISFSARRVRLGAFLRRGLRFAISCDKPCALVWGLGAADRRTQSGIHTGCGCLGSRGFRPDYDFGGAPRLAPPGPQQFTVRVRGATKKGLGRLRRIRVRFAITAHDANGVQSELTRTLTIRR